MFIPLWLSVTLCTGAFVCAIAYLLYDKAHYDKGPMGNVDLMLLMLLLFAPCIVHGAIRKGELLNPDE